MAAAVPESPGVQTDDQGKVMTTYLLISSGFIFMTLIGQTLLEAGLARRNSANFVLVKNVLMLSAGVMMWWLTGYAFSYISVDVFLGEDGFAGDEWGATSQYARAAAIGFIGIYVLFIINGAVMERVQFLVYMATTVFLMGIVWPAVVAWVWGGGWLMEDVLDQDFIDRGGAAVIHLFAGGFALPALFLTKRSYKVADGRVAIDMTPNSLPLAALGVFFEMIGLVYINAVNSPSVRDAAVGFFNTWLSGGTASLIALFLATLGSRKCEDYYVASLKGFIAGMVGVSGFATNCMAWEAFVQGIIVGVLFSLFGILFRRFEDRAYVVSAHLIAGFASLFGTAFWDFDGGVYHNGRGTQIGFQMVGISCILFWAFVWGCLIFGISLLLKCLSLSDDIKEDGLEMAEMAGEGFYHSGKKASE